MKNIVLLSIAIIMLLIENIGAQDVRMKFGNNGLFYGYNNEIEISIDNNIPSDIFVEIDNGEINGEKGKYIIKPKKIGVINLSVFKNDASGAKALIANKKYMVKAIPDPFATVAGKKGGEISKEELLKANGLTSSSFNNEKQVVITAFTLGINKGGYFYEARVDSNYFYSKQIEFIKECEVGQKIYIDDIHAKDKHGNKRYLPAIVFIVK